MECGSESDGMGSELRLGPGFGCGLWDAVVLGLVNKCKYIE